MARMESGGIPKAAGAAVQAGGLSLPALLIICFTDAKTESQRSEVLHPKSRSKSGSELGFKPSGQMPELVFL